ncbi:MAG: type II secretion system F family protein [Acidimicrobiales bacterium]
MTSFALLGGVFGCGLVCMIAGARARRPLLVDVVARFDASNQAGSSDQAAPLVTSKRPVSTGIGTELSRLSARFGRPLTQPEDLAVLERDENDQLAAIGMSSICLGAGGALACTAISATIVSLPPYAVVTASVLGAVFGMFLPGVELKRQAAAERQCFLRALGCWLELIALAQAGGMGVEGALQASSEISDDRSFVRLRGALDQAQLAATTPWNALARLGRVIGVPQLDELACTLSLAGAEGARVRTTLVAKATSLRQRQMADAQAQANATTERLFLPSIILMLAFMIFLMYPAGVRLAHVF